MKNTSQHYCDKTMDHEMALYRECCFPNCSKSCWKMSFGQVLGGRSPPFPGSAPGGKRSRIRLEPDLHTAHMHLLLKRHL